MSEKIYILSKVKEHKPNFILPDVRTTKYVDSLVKISQADKDNLIEDAMSILSHCIPPSVPDNITNIAVGYVQSGKTMSFTLLTALAADNGYKIVIYLTGTKTNLQGQTYDRLRDDLQIGDGDNTDYILFEDNQEATFDNITYIKDLLSSNLIDSVLLFPILKHYSHINNLAAIFSDVTLKPILEKVGVLIIDDEADQASFNTYARKNASGPDWGKKDKFSRTYASIVNLRNAFPSHSYVQYTATPQAAFLIDNNDILSPQYQTVLRPGSGYTGGQYFFEQHKNELIRVIPPEEVYHKDRNKLTECPKSLVSAVLQFIVSIVVVCYIKKEKKYLSMMIHQDGSCETNELFNRWISGAISDWKECLKLEEDDPSKKELINNFLEAYKEITCNVQDAPTFEKVLEYIPLALLFTKTYLIQSNAEKTIDWKKTQKKGHILVGAEMLGRGFTIENLSMSYMSRTTVSKATADTIEQRCRFFGYKLSYIDICRVYLPEQSIADYCSYVTFEEIMRANLSQCESVKEFTKNAPSLVISSKLNPTRKNILSKEIVRNKLSGWRQMRSLDFIDENNEVFETALKQLKDKFEYTYHFADNPARNHRYVRIDIDSFMDFFKQIQYKDIPNITRKLATLQYLVYLKEKKKLDYVYLYEMSYDFLRERKLTSDLEIQNLQMGQSPNGQLPGDKEFCFNDSLCFQIHHFKIEQNATMYSRKELYNIVVYYPKSFEQDYLYIEQDEED